MKKLWFKKDGTTQYYKNKNINDIDALCNIYNAKHNLKNRDIGSIEQQKDMYGMRVVKIMNNYGGHCVLCEGSKKEIIQYLRTLLKTTEDSTLNLKNKLNNLDFDNDLQLIDFIKNTNSDLYNGVDVDGNTLSVGIEKDVGIRISTYQSNGWIRVNEYTIETDELGDEYISRSELYDK